MESQVKNAKILNVLSTLHDRAVNAVANNNMIGASYLACMAGMWAHTLHQSDTNLFQNDNPTLYSWFLTGYDASKNAMESNEKLKAFYEQREKLRLKAEKQNKK